MKKLNWICTGREDISGDPESLDAALAPFKKWIASDFPDPMPEEMIIAVMKNNKCSRKRAKEAMERFRSERKSKPLAVA